MTQLFKGNTGFADLSAQRFALGKLGKGGFLETLGADLQRLVYPALAASGSLEYATAAALKAVPVADITETLALEGVTVIRAMVRDRGDGNPSMFEWSPASSLGTSAFVLTPDDNGSSAGRWIGLSSLDRFAALTDYQSASANPTVNDDDAHGSAVGFLWTNTATNEVFVCLDATAGAAVWKTIKPIRASYAPAAASKRVTATTTKTLPTGLALTLPANFPVGGRIKYKAAWLVVGSNGTDTGAFSIETSDGAALASVSAFDMTNSDMVVVEGEAVVQATGASASLTAINHVGRTGQTPSFAGTAGVAPNLSASRTVGPYTTLSSSNAGNIVDTRLWECEAWSLP